MKDKQPDFIPSDATELPSDVWISILKDPKVTQPSDLLLLHTFFSAAQHELGAGDAGRILKFKGDSPHAPVNSKTSAYAKKIASFFKIKFSENSKRKGKLSYWDFFFKGYYILDKCIWRMRPALVKAWEELEQEGFIQPIIFNQKLVEKYKRLIQIHAYKQEGYKWQLIEKWNGHPSIDAEDFAEEIKQIDFSNLLFHNARRVSHHIAQERSEQYRTCFKSLFDTKISLQERVSNFTSETLKLYRDIEPENKLSHHHDERTISAFLAYHNSEKYILYKSSFHKKYCDAMGIKRPPSGQRYVHYLELAEDFKEKYIRTDKELLRIVKSLLPEKSYADKNLNLLTQDILYSMLEGRFVDIEQDESETPIQINPVKPSQNISMLNQILYGPPGTGKTYHTVNKAISIANPDFDLNQEREVLKAEFDRLQSEGRIVFTTFHQSMSYEDFVEGIKPVFAQEENDSKLAYQIKDGIFKQACTESAYSLLESNKTEKTEKILDFSKVYEKVKDEISEELQEKDAVELTTKSGGKIIIDDVSAQGNFIMKHPGKERTYTVSKSRLARLHTALGDLSEISNFNDTCRSVIGGSNSSAYWAVLNKVREVQKQPLSIFTKPTIDKSVSYEDKKVAVEGLDRNAFSDLSIDKNYVLIIDEINRGNVSQIFGELITLIEPDKRLGNAEVLTLTLPYSKTEFGVPPNLHIIGTMNTADRSVEALDAALRRRFTFTEMPPDANIIRKKEVDQIGDFNTADILETINNRIKILLDRDHLIGHSYFLKVKNIEDLHRAFVDRIIPLLQEYFYGDYSKIALVLGKGFCDVDEQLV